MTADLRAEGDSTSPVHPARELAEGRSGVRISDCLRSTFLRHGKLSGASTIKLSSLSQVRDIGVVLGHGAVAAEWRNRLQTELAVALAKEGREAQRTRLTLQPPAGERVGSTAWCAGYVVIRFCCKQKESRRQRMYEKALDACATSPYGRSVRRWILAGEQLLPSSPALPV